MSRSPAPFFAVAHSLRLYRSTEEVLVGFGWQSDVRAENKMNTVFTPSDQRRTNSTRPAQSHRNHYDPHLEVIAHPLGEALKRLFLSGKAANL